MKKNWNILGLAIMVVAICISCGKVPQAEIDAARSAMDSLKAHGADKIMTEEFTALQTTMDDAMKVVNEQNAKTFKNYGAAKEKLAKVAADGSELDKKVLARKAELMATVTKLTTEVSTLNNDSKNIIPNTPNISTNLRNLKNDARAVDVALAEVKTMVDNNDLNAAIAKLEELKKEAERINSNAKSSVRASSTGSKVPKTTRTTSGQMAPMKKPGK